MGWGWGKGRWDDALVCVFGTWLTDWLFLGGSAGNCTTFVQGRESLVTLVAAAQIMYGIRCSQSGASSQVLLWMSGTYVTNVFSFPSMGISHYFIIWGVITSKRGQPSGLMSSWIDLFSSAESTHGLPIMSRDGAMCRIGVCQDFIHVVLKNVISDLDSDAYSGMPNLAIGCQ